MIGSRMRQRKVSHRTLLLDRDAVARRHASQAVLLSKRSSTLPGFVARKFTIAVQFLLQQCSFRHNPWDNGVRVIVRVFMQQMVCNIARPHPAGRLRDIASRFFKPRPQALQRALAHRGADHLADALHRTHLMPCYKADLPSSCHEARHVIQIWSHGKKMFD